MGITVCTVSGKGGTGKSTVSSGLSIAAAQSGKSVLLIDLDCGLRCLDIIFGIDDKIVFDLSDALNSSDIKTATYKSLYYDNIDIIPAPLSPEPIDFRKLYSLVSPLQKDYDFIILDFPAGADFNAYNIFSNALFLIVSNADSVSLRDAAAISNNIRLNTPPRLVLNRFNIEMIKCGIYKNIDSVIDTALTRLIGIVPDDTELLTLSLNHKLKPKGRAVKAFSRILSRISGQAVPLPKLKKI